MYSIQIYSRLLVSSGLTFCLMLGVVAAQHRSADIFHEQVVQKGKATETEDPISEAFKAFEELLAVSKSAAAPNSHWRVRLASWRNAQEAWENGSAMHSAPQDLNRCAVMLSKARGLIEQADALFLQARDSSDPRRAVELLDQHKKLQRQAKGPLKRAERCFRAARNAYLKRRGQRRFALSRIVDC